MLGRPYALPPIAMATAPWPIARSRSVAPRGDWSSIPARSCSPTAGLLNDRAAATQYSDDGDNGVLPDRFGSNARKAPRPTPTTAPIVAQAAPANSERKKSGGHLVAIRGNTGHHSAIPDNKLHVEKPIRGGP